jgi:hypothetical protein
MLCARAHDRRRTARGERSNCRAPPVRRTGVESALRRRARHRWIGPRAQRNASGELAGSRALAMDFAELMLRRSASTGRAGSFRIRNLRDTDYTLLLFAPGDDTENRPAQPDQTWNGAVLLRDRHQVPVVGWCPRKSARRARHAPPRGRGSPTEPETRRQPDGMHDGRARRIPCLGFAGRQSTGAFRTARVARVRDQRGRTSDQERARPRRTSRRRTRSLREVRLTRSGQG